MAKIQVNIHRISPTKNPVYGYVVHTSEGIFKAPAGDMPLEVGKVLNPPPTVVIDAVERKILGIQVLDPASA